VHAAPVLNKPTAHTKCLGTELAYVRFNTCMNTTVYSQPTGTTKCLVACATFVRLFVCVGTNVNSQIRCSAKHARAQVTLVFVNTTAVPHVLFEMK